MNNKNSLFGLFRRIWFHLSKRRRVQLCVLLGLMIMASIAEVMSISSILPFLGVLTNPDQVFNNPKAQVAIKIFDIKKPSDLLFPLTLIFSCAALISGALRLTFLWAQTRLSFAVGADFSINIYNRTLYQDYAVHLSRNSSEVISGISTKANGVIFQALMPTLTIFSSLMTLGMILVVLFFISPSVTIYSIVGFGIIYAIVIGGTKKQLAYNSAQINKGSNLVIKLLQEGLGSIRDILLDGNQEFYSNNYNKAVQNLRKSQAQVFMFGATPRFGIETLGMVLIAILSYNLAVRPQGVITAIPILGAFALGAQRLLPILQQSYSGWTSIKGGEASLRDTLDLLDQPLPVFFGKVNPLPMAFNKSIALSNISFRYSELAPYVLKNITLEIQKGSRVGFIGATGSGKSTILDIIMGLLKTTEGVIKIDGVELSPQNIRSWQLNISHVPQTIFLADSTIAENIAFGVPPEEINFEKLLDCSKRAQIAETIDSWEYGYRTVVGERGVRLSGGQRQRIGIARALYKNTNLIIFDEATSALDNLTEGDVMEAIDNLGKDLTILIVAHRLTTLKNCNVIVELDGGFIKRIGPYSEIIGK